MAQIRVLSAAVAAATLALPLQLASEAQGRGFGPTRTPSALRAIPTSRPADQADRESLTPEEFVRRAGRDESSRDGAVNRETFLRNEFGVRTFGYTSFVVDPSIGQMPPITPVAAAGRKAMASIGTFGQGPFNTFTDFSLYDRCNTRGVGGIFPVLYGNGVRISQTPNEVIISYSCHEGNGAVSYALSGERAYERMVADAKAKGMPTPPRTMGTEVYSGAPVEGRQPVRELGGGK